MSANDFERVVLITGAASGIGAAVAGLIAGPGCSLLIHTGRSDPARKNDLDLVANTAENAGAKVILNYGDLCEEGVSRRLIDLAQKEFGGLDQIVSNAGFADRRLIGDVDREALDRSFKVMPGAFFELISTALPILKKSKCGRVVAVSSFVAHVFQDDALFPVTAAAKAGVEALAQSLATQLAPFGTTVNCVVPGYTKKDSSGHSALSGEGWERAISKTPVGRIAEPIDHAELIRFLLSECARHITGQIIHVDGGLTLS